MEEKIMYGFLTVYRERGYYLRRLEQFEKAKASYDEALSKFPDDVRLLIGRSQACAEAVKPKEAYENAESALKISPSNMNAQNVQACALYTLNEFERSLMMNHRGVRMRKNPPYFRDGISQGIETLEDTIGANAGPVMLEFLPLIKENMPSLDDEDAPEMKKHVSRIPSQKQAVKQSQSEIRKRLLLSRVLAMKYLGPMASDKFFLQELKEDRRLNGANKNGAAALKELIDRSLNSLSERQEMLRAQRPYYTIKHAEKSESSRLTKFKKELLDREREMNLRLANRFILLIEKTMRENNMMSVMTQAIRFQKFLDSKTPRTLPDIDTYLDRLYIAIGKGYCNMHRLSYTLSDQGNRRRIEFLMGLPIGRPKSFDSVMAQYPYKFVDLKDATEHVMLSLDACENPYMKCWLMYELACLLNKQQNYALGKFYAKRCQYEAYKLGAHSWWLNGCFALMGGDMQQRNVNDVRIAVEEAFNYSKKLMDPEETVAFLQKCLEITSEPVIIDENKAVRKRELEILRIMDEKSKVDTGVLFKRMSTIPSGRRFRVLPTKPLAMNMESERTKYRQHGLSVIPGKEKGLRPLPRSKILGFQDFGIKKTERK